ncbi:ShlB/FhaC/HecB family hemolysin secretion/activation protein [Yersinia ruckeri]|uniref:ShlB/FhaC/HecB family hemolysin secretion/activation protein n=1 Tax=Yersinia ruckeri TaxID=29486 RepID=UPI0020C141FC|nr:ShlB/FhaC/HecB family hemolysin secretion/activation protein [Yersinia ruckeri]MCK8585770.1 ShlB/FhaC/HecB family hemolysin secretion/activation protein [Yersinia ruckeri]
MIKKYAAFLLLLSAYSQGETLPNMGSFSPMSESRRALQDSSRTVQALMEERRYQQLKKQQLLNTQVSAQHMALPVSAQCLPVSGVYLRGVTLLKNSDLESLTALPDSCISSNDINRLTNELTQLYVKKGYITARVQFIPPNQDGELGINITEGIIEKITGGDHWVNSDLLFPGLEGKPLNLSQLDQGLDQANRLQSNTTKLDILPGEKSGGSIIQLNSIHTKSWLLAANLDNYGQKSTGEWLAKTTASLDSPFGLSDFVSLNISSTLKDPQQHYSRAYTMLYSVPYGSWTFSSFASFSEYLNHQRLAINTVKLDGNTKQYGLRTDYVFYRDQDQINSLTAQLTYKNVNNYFESSKLRISSPTLTVLELGANHMQILPHGLLNLNASVEQGLTWFGADRTHNLKSSGYPNAEFTKAKVVASLSQRFKLFDNPYQLSHVFFGQHSNDPLPGVEWLSLTDRSSVRGFSRSTLSGDNGWYLQNTLSRTMPIGNSTMTPRLGADTGRVQARHSQKGWQSSAGLSTGVTFHHKQVLIDVEASRGWLLSEHQTPLDPIQVLAHFSYIF